VGARCKVKERRPYQWGIFNSRRWEKEKTMQKISKPKEDTQGEKKKGQTTKRKKRNNLEQRDPGKKLRKGVWVPSTGYPGGGVAKVDGQHM